LFNGVARVLGDPDLLGGLVVARRVVEHTHVRILRRALAPSVEPAPTTKEEGAAPN